MADTTCNSSGPSSGDILAITAFVISIAALITTVLQALQQYLATAEGFRRCAPSVMGLWSRGTHSKFRWRELRFEVIFETPVLFVAFPGNTKGPIKRQIFDVDGSDKSYDDTNTMKPGTESISNISTADDEKASWVTFLEAIQRKERDSRKWENDHLVSVTRKNCDPPKYTVLHQLQKKTRSYDFVPSSVTKPFATTTISHLAEATALLGMFWKSFNVARGNLRAEGNGYMLTSTIVNGLGLMVSFSITGQSKFLDARVIPSYDVKEFVFGFVPSILERPLDVGNVERMKKTLTTMRCDAGTIAEYELKKDRASMFSVTFEFIGMLAKPLRIRGSNFRMLPNPTADRWLAYASQDNPMGSVIDWTSALEAFEVNLRKICDHTPQVGPDPQVQALLTEVGKIKHVLKKICDIDMREAVHDGLDMTTEYLQDRSQVTPFDIMTVVTSHITAIITESEGLQSTINSSTDPASGLIGYYFTEILPEVSFEKLAEAKRRTVWFTLVFRLICWFILHDFDEMDINLLPYDMKGSRMPVFIG